MIRFRLCEGKEFLAKKIMTKPYELLVSCRQNRENISLCDIINTSVFVVVMVLSLGVMVPPL
jgi:hypothetical protein